MDESVDLVDGTPNFGLLRRKTQLILKRLQQDAQGYKNFTIESRPLGRLFSGTKVATMVGRSRTTLKKLEDKIIADMKNGELPKDFLPPLERNSETGRVVGYPFPWVQAFREAAGTSPWRDPAIDEPFILAVCQFKGGVGKTETVSNLARHLALKGYRILVIDMDHQGSLTGSFGYFPDMVFKEQHTVIPYIKGEEEDLEYAVQKTAWPNIDLIPGCMALEEFNWAMADYALQAETSEDRKELFYELRRGIETVSNNYDMILIDSPPSSSINSFEIIAAADGVIVPIPPRKHDLASTEQFLGIAERLTQTVDDGNGNKAEGTLSGKKFKFLRFLVTQFVNEGNRSKNDSNFYEICRGIYSSYCYEKVFRMISNIKEAARDFTTVYEVEKPNSSVLQELDAVFEQIEMDILRHWPSKQDQIRQAGLGG
ncbi:AAA family ATPase [Microbulbifer epialgicus]|uniref:AAA family ATPase n=1 Tax=Microbulbifer epialgicus TaxID=393907 RepID=A0ABV4NV59_9GAMM